MIRAVLFDVDFTLIAPGPMFSARRQYGNFIRLNYGHPWTSAMERAIKQLGEILRRY